MGWLHVDDGRFVDESGREILFQGMNARIEGVFDVTFSDGRERLEPIPLFSSVDAEAMADLGINLLRLPINWSGVEPEEGQFDEAYLQRVDEVIAHCRNAGIYVLVDFHQDAYSKELGEDGAPYWAILPEPETLREGPLTDLHQQRGSQEVLAAFDAFFSDEQNLIGRFLPAVELVVSRYLNESAVVGFELMNEPVALHVVDGITKLYDFYHRAVEAIRRIDKKHTVWMEPDASRNFILSADLRDTFPDENIVYTPHMYPPLSDTGGWDAAQWYEALTETYTRKVEEKDSWGGALVLGEWGTNPRNESSIPYLRASRRLFNERLMGHAFWLWKENCQGWRGLYSYTEDDDSWTLNENAAKEIGQPTVHAAPGNFRELSFDPETLRLTAMVDVDKDGWAQMFLPERWFGQSFRATMDGKALDLTSIGYHRYEALLPKGTHTLVIEADK